MAALLCPVTPVVFTCQHGNIAAEVRQGDQHNDSPARAGAVTQRPAFSHPRPCPAPPSSHCTWCYPRRCEVRAIDHRLPSKTTLSAHERARLAKSFPYPASHSRIHHMGLWNPGRTTTPLTTSTPRHRFSHLHRMG
ncbi:hypothetical protein N658DRAFT_185961 [Parathielavia hyrcaniae]|uniref:Uncharacterized protein n=1 Tax=Parathielavia hyrcaniae TaxID=113614 RepID=A0AAN6T572_9PEZI|nr:hypothetical protein N658DRAFT_185961 [Parathielavia hyrcaniae]